MKLNNSFHSVDIFCLDLISVCCASKLNKNGLFIPELELKNSKQIFLFRIRFWSKLNVNPLFNRVSEVEIVYI